MFKLDNNLLKQLGLASLAPEEKTFLLTHIYETLELRVGMVLAEEMTDAQLDDFESFVDGGDEAGGLMWLEANIPDYKKVVATKLEILKTEVKEVADRIVEESRLHPLDADKPERESVDYSK
jgi:hypothetical protein